MADDEDFNTSVKSLVESIEAEPDKFTRTNQVRKAGFARTDLKVVYAVDSNGDLHPLVDTDGFLSIDPLARETILTVSNVFTKDAVGTTGTVAIRPLIPIGTTGDQIKLLYGNITTGPVRATDTGDLVVDIATLAEAPITRIGRVESAITTTNPFFLPSPGSVLTATNIASSNNPDQMRIFGSDGLLIKLFTMANAETFSFDFRFLGGPDTTIVITATAGVLS